MAADLIKSGQLLDQKMLQNTSGINLAVFCPEQAALPRVPLLVVLRSPTRLRVFKIRNLPVQNLHIAGLIDIEFGCHLRPESVIHPYTCDPVAVRDKVPVALSDDRGVGSVDPDPAEVFLDHLSYTVRIHEKKREAVLPEIAPSPAASSVIVMGQERTAEQPSEKRLEADPFHQTVKISVAGMKSGVDFLPPPGFCLVESLLYFIRRIVFLINLRDGFSVVFRTQDQDVIRLLPGGKMYFRETESAHRFSAGGKRTGRHAGTALADGARVRIGSAFSQKFLYSGEETFRSFTGAAASVYIVDHRVGTVPALVKGHCRADKDPVGFRADAVEHGSYISVIPYIVGAPPVDRNCGEGNQDLCAV